MWCLLARGCLRLEVTGRAFLFLFYVIFQLAVNKETRSPRRTGAAVRAGLSVIGPRFGNFGAERCGPARLARFTADPN